MQLHESLFLKQVLQVLLQNESLDFFLEHFLEGVCKLQNVPLQQQSEVVSIHFSGP